MKAIQFEPAWPSVIRAGPTVWRTVLQSKNQPKTWTILNQVDMLVELGVALPEEFDLALLSVQSSVLWGVVWVLDFYGNL